MDEAKAILHELSCSVDVIDSSAIEGLLKAVNDHWRIFVYGTGRSGLMLKAFAMRLMQLDYPVFVVGETITPAIERDDLLIVASASGETPSVVLMAKLAQKQEARLFTICSNSISSLARVHIPDIVIKAPSKCSDVSSSSQPLGSLFEQMLLLLFDGLVLCMEQEGKGSNQSMAQRHASLE